MLKINYKSEYWDLQKLTALHHCHWLLQSSALRDITTTAALTAASAVPWARTKESLDRTTVSPALETPPPTSMAPLTSCNAKVCISVRNEVPETNTLKMKFRIQFQIIHFVAPRNKSDESE